MDQRRPDFRKTSGRRATISLDFFVSWFPDRNQLMQTQRNCPLLALVFVAASVAGCHSSEPASTTAPPPPPAAVQQSAIQMQEYQINHSNLPPDQKQRLLDQIRASGGKK
jgi:hypothetical protein